MTKTFRNIEEYADDLKQRGAPDMGETIKNYYYWLKKNDLLWILQKKDRSG